MERVNATRMELLLKRAQIKLAEQGRELLKRKRDSLWQELSKTMETVLRESGELERLATAARQALAWAAALDGREALASAALAARRNISIEVSRVNVMGVIVPNIEQKRLVRSSRQRNYSLAGTSSRIDSAAAGFEAEMEMVLEVATRELRLRSLIDEMRKTTMRVNALELLLLPRLAAQCRSIENVLNEHEREDAFRLRHIKKLLRAKSAGNFQLPRSCISHRDTENS